MNQFQPNLAWGKSKEGKESLCCRYTSQDMSELIVTCSGLLENNQLKEDHKTKERRK
jgi:hypothetical protein